MIVKEKIFESPDFVCLSGKYSKHSIRKCAGRSEELSWDQGYAFGYYEKTFYLSRTAHGDMRSKDGEILKRSLNMKYPGRIWPKAKIISFWKYPAPSRIRKVIKDLEKELENLFIESTIWDDPKYKIEIIVSSKPKSSKTYRSNSDYSAFSGDSPGDLKWNLANVTSKFITPKKYELQSNIQQRSKEEIEQEHEISPMLKKTRSVPSDVGSKRYASRRPLAWSQKLYQESYKAQHVYENIEFERGLEPKQALSLGSRALIKKWFDDLDISPDRYTINTDLSIEVKGDLWLRGTNISSLPNNLSVGGRLDLRETNITLLPDNLSVKGYLDIEGTNITSLPDNLSIEGTIYKDF